MLQSMRDNMKGAVAIILALLFGGIMVVTGIDFFTGSSGGSANKVAEVNGEKISELDLQRAIQNRRNAIMNQYGQSVPEDLLSDERLRAPVLQDLVSNMVLRQAADEKGMVMSKVAVDQTIAQMPAFQINGAFDPQIYRDALRRMGYSAANFRQILERDLVSQQYADGVAGSSFSTRADAEQIIAISMEERDFDYVILPVSEVVEGIEVSASEVDSYYQENQAEFARPEQVAIEYIELKPEIFAENIDVAEEDVRAQYEQELQNAAAKTSRRAAHILIEEDEGKIAEVQAELDKGADFAEVAKSFSEDIVSAEEGGDLGFTEGDVFPENFEQALAALEVGQVSGPVKTDSGTHFIKLLEIKEENPPSFEERRAAIEKELRAAGAEQEFVDALSRLADLAYNAEDLAGPAEELGVELKTTPLFGRNEGTGITANDTVASAAFSPEVMEDGNTSDVMNLSENHSVVLRVTEHQPAGTYPLETVRARIVDTLKRDKASQQLSERANALVQRANAGEDFGAIAEQETLTIESSDKTRRGGFGQRGEIVTEAFSMAAPESGSRTERFAASNGDQVVIQLRAVRPGSLVGQAPEQRQALLRQLASVIGNAEMAAVQKYLSDSADVDVPSVGVPSGG